MGDSARPTARFLVAPRDRAGRPTVGFRLTAGAGTGPASRSQPGREVPDDHCRPIHRARHDPARLHRRRTNRPGRVPRPDPRGLRPGPAPVRQLVPNPVPGLVRRPPRRHRRLRQRAGSSRPDPGHRHPAAVHHRRVLQVRRRRRAPGPLTRRPRAQAPCRLRVPCGRAGPQRARRAARRRRARAAVGACADLSARAEWAAGIGGRRRRRRAPGSGARAPDPDRDAQGRQGGHLPAGAAYGPGNRPGHRRTHRRAGVPGQGRPAAGPARRREDRPPHCPPCRDHKDRYAPHATARFHHRRARRRSAAAGRARGRLACRSADDDAV